MNQYVRENGFARNAARALMPLCLCAALMQTVSMANAQVHVTLEGSFIPDGSIARPYDSVRAGLCEAESGELVRIAPGTYPEHGRFSDAGRLTSTGGRVRIGATSPQNTDLRVISYNLHLFGMEIQGLTNGILQATDDLPIVGDELRDWLDDQITDTEWQDPPRNAWLARALAQENAHVIGIQEMWDPGFINGFRSEYGVSSPFYYQNRRINESWDILGFDVSLPFALNSGLATVLTGVTPIALSESTFVSEDGFFETLSTKGFQRVTVVKDGFTICIFNTHTQSGYSQNSVGSRIAQILQLALAVSAYQTANPTHPVIVMGDINARASSAEYTQYMNEYLGSGQPLPFTLPSVNAPRLIDAGVSVACSTEGTLCTSCASNELRQYFNPDDSESKRIDYVLYQSSLDGSVRLTPTTFERLEYRVPATNPPLSQNGFTTRQLSDHYGLKVDFKVSR